MMSATAKVEQPNEISENSEITNIVGFPAANQDEHIAALRKDAEEKMGKGLSKISGPGEKPIYRINPYVIQVKPDFNGRDFTSPENEAWVDNLAGQIKEDGVVTPLIVFYETDSNGKKIVYLVDGECRLRATRIAIEKLGAPILTVPVYIVDRGNEGDRVFAQYRANNGGKPFTTLESARVFKKAISYGYTVAMIATKTGMTAANVQRIMDFDENTTHEIKELVRENVISTGLATQVIAATKNQGQAVKVLKTAVKKAAAEGREHVTAKDVGGEVGAKLNVKKTMYQIIDRAKVSNTKDGISLKMSEEDYTLMLNVLGFVAPIPV
jgi:ParB-like chromosome segregation protein Spo0J